MSRRFIIVGPPRAGKTTMAHNLAQEHGIEARSTDDLRDSVPFSESGDAVAPWFDAEGDFIIEGVSAVRGLRSWLAANPGKALDAHVVLLANAVVSQTPEQANMGKGILTVWSQIESDLCARGALVSIREQGGWRATAGRFTSQEKP